MHISLYVLNRYRDEPKKSPPDIIVNMQRIESKQNEVVEGKRCGCISPLIAIAALKIAKPVFSKVGKNTRSGFVVKRATYPQAPSIE